MAEISLPISKESISASSSKEAVRLKEWFQPGTCFLDFPFESSDKMISTFRSSPKFLEIKLNLPCRYEFNLWHALLEWPF